ncbi:MAG: arginyltransferase [Planctomycetes bacterium]|nr:arginyltransferase [Planctomycetota bacterium]
MRTSFQGFVPSGPCPYFTDREWAQDVFVVAQMTPAEYVLLLDRGFRRSGRWIYRPRCAGCRECRPLRIPTARFVPSRTQKRILRLNADLVVAVAPPRFDAERLELHNRYVAERHDHAPMDARAYREYFLDSPVPSRELTYRLDGRLVGLALLDDLGTIQSAVYTFYDSALPRRSLGTFSILWELGHALRSGAQWLHLGFHVQGSEKMMYKSNFRPCEKLGVDGQWALHREAEA